MNPPVRLGRRYALHTMPAAFELDVPIRAGPLDVDDELLESAAVGLGEIAHVEPPALLLAILSIHLVEVAAEQGCLFTAGARADFEEERVDGVVLGGDEFVLELFQQRVRLGARLG